MFKYMYQLQSGKIKLLSIDIFDTLVFRTAYSPFQVFIEMGTFLKEKYKDKFRFTPYEFSQIRIAAEKKAREIKYENYGIKEVSFDEIYSYFPHMCCSIKELKKLEVDLEKKICYVNPEINKLINQCSLKGIKIVLTSDMYLSSNDIKEILKFNRFDINLIHNFFISYERKASKSDNGRLFRIILKEYPSIKPNEILHIGDNLTSDIINSEKYGILSYHYKLLAYEKGTLFEFEKIKYENLLPEIYALRKLSMENNSRYNASEKVWFNFGATVLGPFLSLFCEWIISVAEKENINELYPLMREGYILEKMLNNIVKNRKLKMCIKSMYVSRKALFLPSLDCFNKSTLIKIFERNNFTVRNLFQTLKILDYIDCFEEYQHIKLENAYEINTQKGNLKENIINYILSEKLIKVINNNIKEQKKLFLKYLEQGFHTKNRFITVDLGFRGTMQSALNNIINFKNNNYPIHLLAFGEECIKNKLLLGIDIRGFIGNAGENIDIVKSITWCPDLIEELMMGDVGSTIGYRINKFNVEPILDKNRISKDELKLKKICTEGILTFQNMFLEFINNKPFLKEKILNKRRDIGKILERFYKIPTYDEAKTFSELHHENNFGSTSISTLIDRDKINILDNISVEKFLELSNPKDIKWPEAMVTIKYPNYFLKRELDKSNKEGYLKTMCTIAKNISVNEVSSVMVYGAGEAGIYLMRALELYNIKVIYLIDRNEILQHNFIDNVEIISLDQAINKGNHIYAIGSFAFKHEIEKDILDKYIGTNIKPQIFMLQELF
ncbi:HAD family hydrolase [Clostridium botulinum]|uniref:HAD family hydrolase n=1 Tax=Clostridium botulinum TaxID=1491 RepID=UPI003DA3CB28